MSSTAENNKDMKIDEEEDVDDNKDMKTVRHIVGIECYRCKQPPFGAYKKEYWALYLHSKCAFCGLENAVGFKWGQVTKKEFEKEFTDAMSRINKI